MKKVSSELFVLSYKFIEKLYSNNEVDLIGKKSSTRRIQLQSLN